MLIVGAENLAAEMVRMVGEGCVVSVEVERVPMLMDVVCATEYRVVVTDPDGRRFRVTEIDEGRDG